MSSDQCQLCPALFFCVGGDIPITPCAHGLFSLPGSGNRSACTPAVFVVVAVNLHILRPDFTDLKSRLLIDILARSTHQQSEYVIVDSIQSADDVMTTTVTAQIATPDAKHASDLMVGLSSAFHSELTLFGFNRSNILSVQVTACAAGFELISTLTCQICPSTYFCEGGSVGHMPCPAGTYSPPGSNSSSSCTPVIFVAIDVSYSLTSNTSIAEFYAKFVHALVKTAKVLADRVVILSADQRAEKASMFLSSEIAADDLPAARAIAAKIDQTSLNKNLISEGLTPVSISKISITGAISAENSSSNLIPLISGLAAGFVVLLMVSFVLARSYLEEASEDEKQLRKAVSGLLIRLHMTPREGYLLSSKGANFCWRGRAVVWIQRSHAEAASRLGQLQDFDLSQFDAFCLHLQGEDIADAVSRNPQLRFSTQQKQIPGLKQYYHLCEWLLELSKSLIRPRICEGEIPSCSLSEVHRFPYFLDRVCKAHIWKWDPWLFHQLQVDMRGSDIGGEESYFEVLR